MSTSEQCIPESHIAVAQRVIVPNGTCREPTLNAIQKRDPSGFRDTLQAPMLFDVKVSFGKYMDDIAKAIPVQIELPRDRPAFAPIQ